MIYLSFEQDGSQTITAVIVGSGHRAVVYASYSLFHPDELKIVGIVEPNNIVRENTADKFGIAPENCFNSVEELVRCGKIADVAINGTMDNLHVSTTLPLLEAGYDILLEKPIATEESEVLKLLESARKHGRTVMICHVLRYAPFYSEIKKRISKGDIGEILSITTEENVSYHHMSVGFVRGKWNNRDVCGSPMLMAKCCHDLDIITWLKSGVRPTYVSSMGNLMYFRKEKMPENAGHHCMVDCSIEEDCIYSAKKLHINNPDRWPFYVWSKFSEKGVTEPTIEQKIESIKSDNPHGRCAWRCDNNVVDHQSVSIEFEDGCTATHNMTGGASRPSRVIHIIGTKGEITGIMDDGLFYVRYPDTRPGHEYSEEKVDVNVSGDAHGGGDLRLVEDFVRIMQGKPPSMSTTNLEDSIYGHLIGYRADTSMLERRFIEIPKL